MGKMSRLGNELYQGRKSIDFIGGHRIIYTVSILIMALSFTIIGVKGMNFGVEFTGGTSYSVEVGSGNATQANADKLRDTIGKAGIPNAEQPVVTTTGSSALTVQTENLTPSQDDEVRAVILEQIPGLGDNAISQQDIGPSWGKEVAQRAILGVIIFLILVVLFIWAYFREWKMSVAALTALLHDVVLTVGVYALSGFQVTPAAVTGVLAILGFSLYDTVVVFDKIKENTTILRKNTQSYADAANLAVNQTLVRSINTSIVALIPIGAILYVSAVQLGASSLQDLALAQFVGMGVGVYSSVMIAPRILVHLKGRETEVQLQARRAKAKKRAMADRYASVPVFSEDMPAGTARAGGGIDIEDIDGFESAGDDVAGYEPPTTQRPEPRLGATGKGRTLPTEHRPVADSGSAGRSQPKRQSRSKRGKR